jgi:hypothetical protein
VLIQIKPSTAKPRRGSPRRLPRPHKGGECSHVIVRVVEPTMGNSRPDRPDYSLNQREAPLVMHVVPFFLCQSSDGTTRDEPSWRIQPAGVLTNHISVVLVAGRPPAPRLRATCNLTDCGARSPHRSAPHFHNRTRRPGAEFQTNPS